MESKLAQRPPSNTLTKRLQDAVEVARERLRAPAPSIMVEDISDSQILVRESAMEDSVIVISVIDRNGTTTILSKTPVDPYRAVIFIGCKNTKIFLLTKLLKATLIECEGCQLSIRGGLVGVGELIRCKNTDVDLRSPIAVIQIDLSSEINLYQRVDEMVYAVCGCDRITSTMIDPVTGGKIKQIPLTSTLFGEQTFMLVGPEESIAVQERYALNDIEHHLLFLTPDEMDEDYDTYIKFGSPPR